MKRLVWLMLFAFGTALAQVTPMEPVGTKPHDQSCCGDCCSHTNKGTSDCAKCVSCVQGCGLAVLVTASNVDFVNPPASRLESAASVGQRLNYPPPLPPPRVA